MNIKQLPNGVYNDKGKFHNDYYIFIGNCVHRWSEYHNTWILCLDENINKLLKSLELLEAK